MNYCHGKNEIQPDRHTLLLLSLLNYIKTAKVELAFYMQFVHFGFVFSINYHMIALVMFGSLSMTLNNLYSASTTELVINMFPCSITTFMLAGIQEKKLMFVKPPGKI